MNIKWTDTKLSQLEFLGAVGSHIVGFYGLVQNVSGEIMMISGRIFDESGTSNEINLKSNLDSLNSNCQTIFELYRVIVLYNRIQTNDPAYMPRPEDLQTTPMVNWIAYSPEAFVCMMVDEMMQITKGSHKILKRIAEDDSLASMPLNLRLEEKLRSHHAFREGVLDGRDKDEIVESRTISDRIKPVLTMLDEAMEDLNAVVG